MALQPEADQPTPLETSPVVYEGKVDDVGVSASRDHTPGFERDFVSRWLTFFTNELYLRRDGQLIKIDKPDHANADVHREWLLLSLREAWTVGGRPGPPAPCWSPGSTISWAANVTSRCFSSRPSAGRWPLT